MDKPKEACILFGSAIMTAAPLYMPTFLYIIAPYMFWIGITGLISVFLLVAKDFIFKKPASNRFVEIMECRDKFGRLMVAPPIQSREEYDVAYKTFGNIQNECQEVMKKANFKLENLAMMKRLGNIDPAQTLDQHIKHMCRKALQVIENTIKDEKNKS